MEAINAYGNTVAVDTTGANGWAQLLVRYRYEADDAADSTAYNDFKWRGTPLTTGAPDSLTITVDWDNYKDTLTLVTGSPTGKMSRRALLARLRRIIS